MSTIKIAALCGFSGAAAERLREHLSSRQFKIVAPNPRLSLPDQLLQLCKGLLFLLKQYASSADKTANAILISSLVAEQVGLEKSYFYPALRVLRVAPTLSNDPHATLGIATEASRILANEFQDAKRFGLSPSLHGFLMLPVLNVASKYLRRELDALYEMEIWQPRSYWPRDIERLRKGDGMSFEGHQYRATTNSAEHPVRRRTDSARCDLLAALRLGVSVPTRFEFDVSRARGLRGSFFQCCGASAKASPSASHLNMRINDDYEEGKR